MSSPALLGHATTLTLPTTGASARLLRPDARLLLVRGLSSAAAATPHAAASPGLACSRHSSVAAAPSTSPQRAGGGGSSDLVALTLTAVAVSACLIFFAAIRSMLACKREAEFLEKYFDSARKKLPESMASLRLVGRELGDLAADLSDLSQELTKGVRSSMSIVHTADAQLRQRIPPALPGSARRMSNQKNVAEDPLLASTLRDLRELIADIRSGLGATAGIAGLFMWVSNFGSKRSKKRL
ncbi:uncharacterized protein LOC120670132 isoform X1 [Panicum virgatum]|uniref:Uncharacterized protein n=1 Tax=Panicum virgatum TaxID=38727 RepID=A0A8T0T6U7_PANVG|nr:uncharacterized protein LOC120670132 isoform X1 [Panicum virgatum]KAG2605368.1 hypothetical protein PVAP13_4NG079400 [Panicum virgatum]